ncbi:MAG: C40 family peptidase [Elusimicrobia bacterium]|nr:C40 family peptidase [Elusimicrobiota bacterium]
MKRPWLLAMGAALAAACSAPQPKPATPWLVAEPPASPGERVVRSARAFLPEEDGGRATPKDAADFIRRVYAESGHAVPGTLPQLILAGARVKSAAELRPGDVVFFCGERLSRIPEHVGLYVKQGVFIHFLRDYGVLLENLSAERYRDRYITARRILE